MSVFKRGKVYYVRFRFQGKTIYRSTQQGSRKVALEFEANLKKELWDQVHLKKTPPKYWSEAAVLYMQKNTKKTIKDDLIIIKWLKPHLNHLPLGNIDFNKIEEIKDLKRAENVKPGTLNKYLQVISRVFKEAYKKKWIDSIPPMEMESIDNARTRWLTPQQAQALSSALPPYLASMMNFTLATGLRESNVRLLKWSQVDLINNTVFISKENVKNKKDLYLPLNQTAVQILKAQSQLNEYVFTHKGRPLYRCQTTSWKNALTECGIKNFRWHDLRHTWASWHVQNGTSLHELQELGGWSDFKMVLRYAHLAVENLKKAAQRLDEVKARAECVQPKLKIVKK